MSKWIRQTHRWVSIAFLLLVIALFAVQGFGVQVAQWVFLVPLLPLFVMAVTGAYMFALPYLATRKI
ncbi:MAG: hypothetical protein ABI832_04335 [bacterium]